MGDLDREARLEAFGFNIIPPKPTKSLLCLVWEALQDVTLRILLVAVLIFIGLSLYNQPQEYTEEETEDDHYRSKYSNSLEESAGWKDGLSILVTVLVVVFVTAFSNWSASLQSKTEHEQIPVGDILVGDISQHDTDISSNNSHNNSSEAPTANRDTSNNQVVVSAAGDTREKEKKCGLGQKQKSLLQTKLTRLAVLTGLAGTAVAVLTVVILIVEFFVEEFAIKKIEWTSNRTAGYVKVFVKYFIIIGVRVLVAALLSCHVFTVTLALICFVKKMMHDNKLDGHLDACYTMSNVTAICSNKTGTLTTNCMTVVQSFIGGIHYRTTPDFNSLNSKLGDLVIESVSVNSGYTSKVLKLEHESEHPKQVGNKTECSLLGFAVDLKQSYEAVREKYPEEVLIKVYTFNSVRKCMSTVINVGNGNFRLYTKGASEIVLKKCNYILNNDCVPQPFTATQQEELVRNVIEPMACEGLRTICIAYKDFVRGNSDVNEVQIEEEPNWDDEDGIVKNLTCIFIVGIDDPVRDEVPDAIRKCKSAGICVRMVTGDNVNTARSIALKCGIITPGEDGLVLEGKEFNRRIRNASREVEQTLMDQVWPQLRVLALSTPQDKYILVKGIIDSKISSNHEVVAVTGDGTNDGLKKADVGFAMGISGADIEKEASVILTDGDLTSIVKAIMWGRNVYDSIAKFLQFQLTVSIVTAVVTSVGFFIINESLLKTVQMLWVYLMGILACLALATELPSDELLRRKPYGCTKPLISCTMFKNICGHALYQLTVIFVLLFKGPDLFVINDGTALANEVQAPPTQHFTMIFNTFVMMTLFNEVNARKIHGQRNIFEGLQRNPLFIGIWIGTLGTHVIIVTFGGLAFHTHKLNAEQWLWCVFLGVGTMLWGQLITTVQARGEEGELGEEDHPGGRGLIL